MASRFSIADSRVWCRRTAIPVAWQGDVIVAGGGPGGLGSSIAAARNGCKTLLIEKYGFLGGMCSYGSGMPLGGAYPGYKTIGGIAEEFLAAVRDAGPESASVRDVKHFSMWYYHDSEYFRSLAFDMVEAAGVEYLLHTMVVDVITQGRKVVGLVTESKSGRQAVLAKAFVDCTGDADIVAWCGGKFVKGRPEDGAMMGVTIPYILADVDVDAVVRYKESDPKFEKAKAEAAARGLTLHADDSFHTFWPGMRPNTLFCNNIRVLGIDGTDVTDLTRGEREARRRLIQHVKFFRACIPGCGKAYITHTGEQVGVRDTRRIVGEDYLSTEQCLALKKLPKKVILRCAGPLDDVARKNNPSTVTPMQDEKDWYDIPYGCIVPKGLPNVLVAGRSFSSSHLAQAGSRGMALLIGMGQGAGTAAALVAKKGIRAKDVDVAELQGTLRAQGMDLALTH